MMNDEYKAALSSFLIHPCGLLHFFFILSILSILFRFFFYLNHYWILKRYSSDAGEVLIENHKSVNVALLFTGWSRAWRCEVPFRPDCRRRLLPYE
jgi:hypothetical protein